MDSLEITINYTNISTCSYYSFNPSRLRSSFNRPSLNHEDNTHIYLLFHSKGIRTYRHQEHFHKDHTKLYLRFHLTGNQFLDSITYFNQIIVLILIHWL